MNYNQYPPPWGWQYPPQQNYPQSPVVFVPMPPPPPEHKPSRRRRKDEFFEDDDLPTYIKEQEERLKRWKDFLGMKPPEKPKARQFTGVEYFMSCLASSLIGGLILAVYLWKPILTSIP